MRSMSLRDMQIPKSGKKISWPPPLPNPGDAPVVDPFGRKSNKYSSTHPPENSSVDR